MFITKRIERFTVAAPHDWGGESGGTARPCRYEWVLNLRAQCVAARVPFRFKQTGTYFIKDGHEYTIARHNHHRQAKKAGINFSPVP